MSGMLPELHRFHSVWATTENKCVMASMSTNAQCLGIYVFSGDGGVSYMQEYDEGALYKVRGRTGENMNWTKFFDTLADSFRSSTVTVWSNGATGTNGHAGYTTSAEDAPLVVTCGASALGRGITFNVPRTDDDIQARILDQMFTAQQLYTYTKDHEHKLAGLKTEVAAARAQTEALEREALSLKENLVRNKQQEVSSSKRLAQLKEELAEDHSEVHNPWTAVKAKERPTPEASRLHDPLIDRTCKDFDMVLLRLIKSRFLPMEAYDPSSPGNSVVQPFTRSDLEAQVRNFSNHQRGIVWHSLDKLDQWDYSVFDVQTAMNGDDYASLPYQIHGGSLLVTMYALLCKYNFLQKFSIDEQVALNWISVVEAGYHGNPYHNSMHAADVLQITHFVLTKGSLVKQCKLTDVDVFSALLSAAIHDYDHPGINNNFHIKTGSHLAILYNDRSVLENLHVSSVFELMKNPAFNILAGFSEDQRRSVREVVVEMVLATDMGLHSKYVARMKGRLQERSQFTSREDQLLALAMALKLADISNCGRPLDIYLKWSGKVSDEFYQQGDRERNLGMQCSPFMDRSQPAIAKGQISFINYIVAPFFEQFAELLPDLRFIVEQAAANKAYWAHHDDS